MKPRKTAKLSRGKKKTIKREGLLKEERLIYIALFLTIALLVGVIIKIFIL